MNKLPSLTPITSQWMKQIKDDFYLLNDLLANYGSPINLINPSLMKDNYQSYQEVLESFGLKYQVFFARKANKCQAYVLKAQQEGMGIDTASLEEYIQCLELGLPANQLIITAAIKNENLLRRAVKEGSLIIIDNEDECAQIQHIAKEQNKKALVAFRLSGFQSANGEKLYSRFGFDVSDFIGFVDDSLLRYDSLEYRGLHFHLDGYSMDDRGAALESCLAVVDVLEAKGLKTEFIDIGGGLLTQYLENEQEWEVFWSQLTRALQGEIPPITFGNNGLGLRFEHDQVVGKRQTYPFWNTCAKGKFLQNILSYQTSNGERIGDAISKRGIELRLEPGRSLLDQTGMTVAKVAFRKKDSRGDWLIGLEMNMSQLMSGSADFLLDPWVVYREKQSETKSVGVYFTGAYCLERDVILKRKIELHQLPEVGDMVVFPNTAGYMMHFFESSAHLFPLASNLIYDESKGLQQDAFVEDDNLAHK